MHEHLRPDPGAGGDGWQWHLLVRGLESRGHEAIAVDLPSGDERAGWSEYADAVVASIGDRRGTRPRRPVARRVHRAARLRADPSRPPGPPQRDDPAAGRDGNDWWGDTGSGAAMRQYHASIGLSAADADDPRILYYHDVPEDVVEEAWARGEPQQTMTPMASRLGSRPGPTCPTRVIAGRDDRLFPLEFQRRVARERLGLDVR
jgi:hypothetical protein